VSIALLELAVESLGDLADDVTFLGGATVGLWITDTAAPPVRATDDVDAVVAATYAELVLHPESSVDFIGTFGLSPRHVPQRRRCCRIACRGG
jgi:hypothetical protein